MREPLKAARADQPPMPPSYLKELAAEEWQRVAPELWRLGLLTMLDIAALAVYCAAFARWRRAIELLAAQKMTIVTDTGLRTHPLVTIANVTARDMTKFGAAFGLSPAARHQLGGVEPSGSKFEGLLA
jgi:P27 family predicted phage terminase small subunit